MARRRVSNQNLKSIFDDNSFDEDEESISTLRLTDIEPNKSQPRKNFDIEALNTLADSIRQNGVIQPLLVRSMPDGTYQIVAGERRWRAAKMAGLTEVPVLVRELTDLQAQQIALIENLQRENLNPIEEANGYKELMDKFGMTQEEVARVVGKARSSIANSLRLLNLPPIIAEMVSNNELSTGHCKVLLGVSETKDMVELAHKAAGKDVSVREMERMVKALDKTEKTEKKKETFYVEAEISLAKALETNVIIVPGKKKSTIQIEFYNDDDLTDIVNRLANNK
jgi:ParB family chromosome partitioning protein